MEVSTLPNQNVRNGRRERITKLGEMMKVRGGKSQRQIIAEFCIETGNTRETALAYLDVLIDAGIVVKE